LGANVVILACSGGSNVGQLTNEAAKKLDQEGVGKFYCLIGVAAGIESMMVNAEGADRVICLDGCSVACAKKALDNAQVPISVHVVATEEGIEKGHHFNISGEEIETVCQKARQMPA
jgi:uncharacterized metal-binding protein